MHPLTIHTAILRLLKSRMETSLLGNLLKELRTATSLEQRLSASREKRKSRQPRTSFSFSDRYHLDHVITCCITNLSPSESHGIILAIGDIFRDHGDFATAEELYAIGIEQAEKSGEGGLTSEAYLRRGDLFSRQSRWGESASDLRKSRMLCSSARDGRMAGQVENVIGTNYALQGKRKNAAHRYARALSLFEKTGEKGMTGMVIMNLGILLNISGRYDEALGQYQRAQSYFEELGDQRRLMELRHNKGMSYFFKETYDKAIKEFDAAIGLAGKLDNVATLAVATLGKAQAMYKTGDLNLALILVNQSLQYSRVGNDRWGIADAYRVKGMICRDLGQVGVAAMLFETSLRMNKELKNELNSAETLYEIALLHVMQSNWSSARTAFNKALELFRRVGAQQAALRTSAQLDLIAKTA